MASRNKKSFSALATEMAFAVPQVMTHRLTRMALAGANPSARDRKEFERMSAEKVDAFYESWMAMGMQALRFNQQLWLESVQLFWTPWTVRESIQAFPQQMNQAANDILDKGMAPVHRRAMSNAKRLGKTSLL